MPLGPTSCGTLALACRNRGCGYARAARPPASLRAFFLPHGAPGDGVIPAGVDRGQVVFVPLLLRFRLGDVQFLQLKTLADDPRGPQGDADGIQRLGCQQPGLLLTFRSPYSDCQHHGVDAAALIVVRFPFGQADDDEGIAGREFAAFREPIRQVVDEDARRHVLPGERIRQRQGGKFRAQNVTEGENQIVTFHFPPRAFPSRMASTSWRRRFSKVSRALA